MVYVLGLDGRSWYKHLGGTCQLISFATCTVLTFEQQQSPLEDGKAMAPLCSLVLQRPSPSTEMDMPLLSRCTGACRFTLWKSHKADAFRSTDYSGLLTELKRLSRSKQEALLLSSKYDNTPSFSLPRQFVAHANVNTSLGHSRSGL